MTTDYWAPEHRGVWRTWIDMADVPDWETIRHALRDAGYVETGAARGVVRFHRPGQTDRGGILLNADPTAPEHKMHNRSVVKQLLHEVEIGAHAARVLDNLGS